VARAQRLYGGRIGGLRSGEGQAQVTGDSAHAQSAADGIQLINGESASVYLYQGMALADQASKEPAESFLGGLWRRVRSQPTTYQRALAAVQDAELALEILDKNGSRPIEIEQARSQLVSANASVRQYADRLDIINNSTIAKREEEKVETENLLRKAKADADVADRVLATTPPRPARQVVIIDPLVDGVTGDQSAATQQIQDRILRVARASYPQYDFQPFTARAVAQARQQLEQARGQDHRGTVIVVGLAIVAAAWLALARLAAHPYERLRPHVAMAAGILALLIAPALKAGLRFNDAVLNCFH